jgi:hypothetical protein
LNKGLKLEIVEEDLIENSQNFIFCSVDCIFTSSFISIPWDNTIVFPVRVFVTGILNATRFKKCAETAAKGDRDGRAAFATRCVASGDTRTPQPR